MDSNLIQQIDAATVTAGLVFAKLRVVAGMAQSNRERALELEKRGLAREAKTARRAAAKFEKMVGTFCTAMSELEQNLKGV